MASGSSSQDTVKEARSRGEMTPDGNLGLCGERTDTGDCNCMGKILFILL